MKTLILSIISAVATIVLLYFAGAFVNADFNISHWGIQSRGICAMLGLFFGCVMFIITYGSLTQK